MTINTERIRALNDAFRQTFVGGKIMLTCGVAALPPELKQEVVRQVQCFDTFEEDNDPHHEHDFLSVDVGGQKFFAKIDYYDLHHGLRLGRPGRPPEDDARAYDNAGIRILITGPASAGSFLILVRQCDSKMSCGGHKLSERVRRAVIIEPHKHSGLIPAVSYHPSRPDILRVLTADETERPG